MVHESKSLTACLAEHQHPRAHLHAGNAARTLNTKPQLLTACRERLTRSNFLCSRDHVTSAAVERRVVQRFYLAPFVFASKICLHIDIHTHEKNGYEQRKVWKALGRVSGFRPLPVEEADARAVRRLPSSSTCHRLQLQSAPPLTAPHSSEEDPSLPRGKGHNHYRTWDRPRISTMGYSKYWLK